MQVKNRDNCISRGTLRGHRDKRPENGTVPGKSGRMVTLIYNIYKETNYTLGSIKPAFSGISISHASISSSITTSNPSPILGSHVSHLIYFTCIYFLLNNNIGLVAYIRISCISSHPFHMHLFPPQ